MMRGELWRFSRRAINNVMTVTGDDRFCSLILMLKIMEMSLRETLSSISSGVVSLQRQVQHLSGGAVAPWVTDLDFAAMDSDKSGYITINELRASMKNDPTMSEDEVVHIHEYTYIWTDRLTDRQRHTYIIHTYIHTYI